MLKILVNARFLIPGKMEGIGLYTYEVVSRLSKENNSSQFILCVDRKSSTRIEFPDNVEYEVVLPPARHPLLFLWWFEIGIPSVYQRRKVHLFFSPDGFLSLNPLVRKSIVVIHDLAYLHFPHHVSWSMLTYYRKMIPRIVRKADRIITVSKATRDDLLHYFPSASEKTSVVYNGVRSMPDVTLLPDDVGGVFFICLGAIHPRKNVEGVLLAFEIFKKKYVSNVRLKIIGRKAWKLKPVKKIWLNHTFRDEIEFTGYLDDDQMYPLLKKSLALVYMSFFEGFGLPIVEAMALGVPVITSDCSSMREIAQGYSLLADPFDPVSIADAMSRIYQDSLLRDQLIELGRVRAKEFSWNKAVTQIWKEFINLTAPTAYVEDKDTGIQELPTPLEEMK